MIFTTEADNVKTVLATKFKDYELSSRRKDAFCPLIGNGIFTNDGADWKHSRELIRPNFVRDQVADLDNFEAHVSLMIDAIPKDGKTTIDLQELFYGLTMDTATEFLFGESANVLVREETPESRANLNFAEAWQRSQLEVIKKKPRGDPLSCAEAKQKGRQGRDGLRRKVCAAGSQIPK